MSRRATFVGSGKATEYHRDRRAAALPVERIVRLDKYTLNVCGTRVRADTTLEERIRAMTDEQLQSFVALMGGRP